MTQGILRSIRTLACGAAALVVAVGLQANSAQAQSRKASERYVPTVWVDPDGCEHWVMDDGVEGYMTPHVSRQGIPVCRRGNVCGVMNSDQLFATDSSAISTAGKHRLAQFFRSSKARAYIIAGHTDARASDEYNMSLSYRRAASVARIGKGTGAKIVDVRGYGERMPVASNRTAGGMQKNRRVEIICIK
ncbi:MAG: OmpA family protein [Vannielia sp.]|uniref:OmpA family protein n=1 Tax=Vannielia sp. TaxID=2813045 RepID=UPI003B8AB782